jgi:hypothetical protein
MKKMKSRVGTLGVRDYSNYYWAIWKDRNCGQKRDF